MTSAVLPGIPRIIHQMWRDENVPKGKGDPNSWRRLNPGWEYRFWTDDGLDRFIHAEFPDLVDLYRSYSKPVQRADLARYCLLKRYGGLYADIDTTCLASLEPLAGDPRVIVCEEPPDHCAPATVRGLPTLYFNGTMASPPEHPLWDDVIAKCRLMAPRRDFDVLETTGPLILTASVVQWPQKSALSLNSCNLFAGVNVHGAADSGQSFGDYGRLTLSEHHWLGSWYKVHRESYFRRKLGSMRKARHRLLHGRRLTLDEAKRSIDLQRLAKPVPAGTDPVVTVLLPVRDAESHLPKCFDLLERLDYPRDRLEIVFGHGDSRDASRAMIEAFIRSWKSSFRSLRMIETKRNGPHLQRRKRYRPQFQRRRRAAIARVRNELLGQGLSPETHWVLWIDSDLVDYPPDILRQLLAARERIVTPNCVLKPGGESFDFNAFLDTGSPSSAIYYRYVEDGLFQPPRDYWFRRHLHDLRYLPRVPLDGVGGTMLLVSADLHRAGLLFPEVPYRDLIETEAFGKLARDLGVTPVGLPNVEIVHAPD